MHTYIHKENQVIKHRTILVCYWPNYESNKLMPSILEAPSE